MNAFNTIFIILAFSQVVMWVWMSRQLTGYQTSAGEWRTSYYALRKEYSEITRDLEHDISQCYDEYQEIFDLLERARPFVEFDAIMHGDITRHAILPSAQITSTESESELLLGAIDQILDDDDDDDETEDYLDLEE